MKRHYYSDTITNFLNTSVLEIIGSLASNSEFADEQTQKEAWKQQIQILSEVLKQQEGTIYFEYSIPRMGKRIDVVLIIKNVIFILEFKVGETEYLQSAIDQVWDYGLDLKNFHETSHNQMIAPILIATKAKITYSEISYVPNTDNLFVPIKSNADMLGTIINAVLMYSEGESINSKLWEAGRYAPTPYKNSTTKTFCKLH